MIATLPMSAVAAGLCFSLIGIAYRFGQARGIAPIQIIVWAAPACALFFGWRAPLESWAAAPGAVWLWAIAGGLGQYLCLRLVEKALRLGPLSPLWCTSNLTFLVTVLFSAVFLDERLSLLQGAGLASGVGAVLAGVWSVAPTNASSRPGAFNGLGQRMEYALVLGLLLLCNSVSAIALKALSRHALPDGGDALSRFSGVFTTTIYAAMWIGTLLDLSLRGAGRRPDRRRFGLAALAGGGSIGGFLLWCLCASQPAAILFTLSSTASVMSAGLVSVIVFREKASAAWFLMMALAALTMVLLNWG